MKVSVKTQLGPLLHQHRPSALWKGWLFIFAISCWPMSFYLIPTDTPAGPLPWIFTLMLFVPFTFMFGEWAFGIHRLYTHALVITATLPFARCRVIPLWTINPDTITSQYRPRFTYAKGTRWIGDVPMEAVSERDHPFARWIVCFTGTSAYLARDHARGRMDLRDHSSQASATWVLADANNRADAELHAQQLRDAITNEPPISRD